MRAMWWTIGVLLVAKTGPALLQILRFGCTDADIRRFGKQSGMSIPKKDVEIEIVEEDDESSLPQTDEFEAAVTEPREEDSLPPGVMRFSATPSSRPHNPASIA